LQKTLTIVLALIGLKDEAFFLENLKIHLREVFSPADVGVVKVSPSLLKEAYTPSRGQYNSTITLVLLKNELEEVEADRILAIADVDLYTQGLNFVFGEAQFPGRIALISLHRLKPEYYGEKDGELFKARIRKEAVHELGHTFGLAHCPNPTCVMHFSNSIHDTDRKADKPCQACREILRRNR
jgi:archaemetzincin